MFLRPQYLPWVWAALCVAGLWLAWHLRRVRAQETRFAPAGTPLKRRPPVRAVLLAGALPVLVLSMAGPSWGLEAEIQYTSGLDLYFLVDCSYSMLARDVAPSRQKAATFLAMSLLKELPGARAGLIAFAGGAFPVCPLTSDGDIIRSLLSQLHPDVLNRQGTNFEAPLDTLARMVSKTDSRRRLAVVFLSDGESFREPSGAVLETLRRRAPEFVAVGVGTPEGAFLEDPRSRFTEWIRDKDGQLVRSRLGEKNLIALSDALGGRYFRLQTVGLTSRQILDGALRNRGAGTYTSRLLPQDQSAWFISAGALLLALVVCTGGTRRKNPRSAAALLLLALVPVTGCGGRKAEALVRQGNDLYARGEYADAAGLYGRAMRQAEPGSDLRALAGANLAAALTLAGRSGEALRAAERSLREGGGPRESALRYNLGCSQVLEERRADAAESFRRCLERNPADFHARWNLELLLNDRQPPPSRGPTPPPPDDQADRFFDSLKDQEKTKLPRAQSRPAGTGGPYW